MPRRRCKGFPIGKVLRVQLRWRPSRHHSSASSSQLPHCQTAARQTPHQTAPRLHRAARIVHVLCGLSGAAVQPTVLQLRASPGLTLQAAALPQFYDERKMGCEIPSMTFGPHAEAGDIVPVDTITFSIQDADGNIAMSWLPGEMYSVTVTAFGDAPVFAWIHSTLGAPCRLRCAAAVE